jgi:glutaminyl-tRNA synthetase
VSAPHALNADIRLYDHLFTKVDPDNSPEGSDFTANLNVNSLKVLTGCKLEPSLQATEPGATYQFERKGYFCADSVDSSPDHLVFNRTVPLRDTWAKIEKTETKT